MSKVYDLEGRTFKFAQDCRKFCKKVSKGIGNREYTKQLVRASGSVAANYIEANESLSKKILYLESRYVVKKQKNVSYG